MDYKDMNAIGIVRLMLTDGVITAEQAAKYFPELTESDDERISKEITTYLSNRLNNVKQLTPRTNQFEEWIAWLEKQGEQKPAEISNICEFSIKTWVKIVDYVLTEHNGIGNYLIDPEVKDTAEKLQKKYKFDAASEEWDRVYRKGLDAGVNKGRAEALREQKSAAWSEEDETRLTNILIMLKEGASHHFIKDDITKAVDWLKSFKDRYTWKPSDEQLNTLYDVLYPCDGLNRDVLESLYVQLKKLREE